MKKIQNVFEYALVISISKLVRLLPLKLALCCGRALGDFIFYIIPIRKKVSMNNLTSVFPEKSQKEIHKIARRTYQNFGQNIVEFMREPKANPKILSERVKFVNQELLEDARKNGKGVILLSGHFGNWEIMAAAISALGYPMLAIAREQRNTLINHIVNDYRAAVNIGTIQLGMALRGVLKALRDNHFIALLGDQDAHDEGVFVNFLGKPSATARGPAIFTLKTGAPLIFASCVRQKDGSHIAYFEKVQSSDLNGLTEENIRILTQRHANVLEANIKKWPDHWFWMHKRWKTKPREKEPME
ncbi:MAG: hypothetical protein GWP06_09000 [Actinobacteria bacterium]|nr:hypothetical protein [Actinomycetota bacterium]